MLSVNSVNTKGFNMKSPTAKLISATLILFLSACAHHQQSYQPYGYQSPGYGYGNGYVIEQRSYYGGHPYGTPYGTRYDSYNYYDNRSYDDHNDNHHHHDRHNRGYVRPRAKPMPINPKGFRRYSPDELRYLQSSPQSTWPPKQPQLGRLDIKRVDPGRPGYNQGKMDYSTNENERRHKKHDHSKSKGLIRQQSGFNH